MKGQTGDHYFTYVITLGMSGYSEWWHQQWPDWQTILRPNEILLDHAYNSQNVFSSRKVVI